MATGMAITFGAIVLIAVGAVLFLSLEAARRTTFDLLGRQAGLISQSLNDRMQRTLLPAWQTVDAFAAAVESERIDPRRLPELDAYMSAAVASTPHLSSLFLLGPKGDGRAVVENQGQLQIGAARELLSAELGAETTPILHNRNPVEVGKTRWGRIVRLSSGRTVINLRRALFLGGRFIGVIAAGVRVDTLSKSLGDAGRLLKGQAFVIYDNDYLLAHPKLASGNFDAGTGHPLPRLSSFDDPVLQAWRFPLPEYADYGPPKSFTEKTGIHIVFMPDGTDRPLILRRATGLNGLPVDIGIYLPSDAGDDVFRRLFLAGGAGLAVMALALIVAVVVARYLSRPIRQLARAADHVRHLRLDEVSDLPTSRAREIDEASRAFAAMLQALRWFQSYVPRQLADRLIGQQALPLSESRDITIMFTDISGFAGLVENFSGRDIAAFLNQHFTLINQCIESEGGIVDKYMGDGVLAFWGAPDDLPDHADRACRSALGIRAAIEAENQSRLEAGKAPVRVRIGIHTGNAVVGNIGAPGRLNYTVVGDAVNLASRLEAFGKVLETEAGGAREDVIIVLSGQTKRALGEVGGMRDVGRRSLPGLSSAIEIWQL